MADLIADLKALRLYGMAACYAECIEQGSTGGLTTYESLLSHLVQAETTDRALRSIRYQMHVARFPIHRDLAGFDFEHSKVDRRQITTFATTAFTEKAENIVLIGGTGTGKTHLAAGYAGLMPLVTTESDHPTDYELLIDTARIKPSIAVESCHPARCSKSPSSAIDKKPEVTTVIWPPISEPLPKNAIKKGRTWRPATSPVATTVQGRPRKASCAVVVSPPVVQSVPGW